MKAPRASFLLMAALIAFSAEAGSVSPIGKVLELLDGLKAKITAEGEVEAEQFDQYTKWCAEETDQKEDSIKFNSDRVASLQAQIEQLNGEISKLGTQIQDVAAKIAVDEKDLQSATEIRDQERSEFEAADRELSDVIDMLVRAKSVLKKQLMFAQETRTPFVVNQETQEQLKKA